MAERPALVAGSELRNSVIINHGAIAPDMPDPAEIRRNATGILDDWQAEIAAELPPGLTLRAVDSPRLGHDGVTMIGVSRVAKIVPVA